MSLFIPFDTYNSLNIATNTRGVYRWKPTSSTGECDGDVECAFCDIFSAFPTTACPITSTLNRFDPSPSQCLIYVDGDFQLAQISDYPEFFI